MLGDIPSILRGVIGAGASDRNALLRIAGFSLGLMASTALAALMLVLLKTAGAVDPNLTSKALPPLFAVAVAGFIVFLESMQMASESTRRERIERVEKRFQDNPQAQNAWDLARVKLESYLDRNLSQVRSIYWLTVVVMAAGLSLVGFGLARAMQDPDRLPVSIVASASGVLVSFIGGSFLIIYRSILAESRGYVSVLERINAVGMAVQVISGIPDESAELKHQTTAELARQLLRLYGRPDAGGSEATTKP